MAKSTPTKGKSAKGKSTKSSTKSKAQPEAGKPERKRYRHSPYVRDARGFRRAQNSTREITPKSVLTDLIRCAANAVPRPVADEPIRVQSGFVEMMDGLLDQHFQRILFPVGAVIRASGAKRLQPQQFAAMRAFNKTAGRGPRWNSRAIQKIRQTIGLNAS